MGNDQNQEEPGQGIQGLKPPMQMGKGKNSNKMIRHPMGKHPRPPMEKNHKEEGSRGFEHFEGKKIVEEKNDQEKHPRPPIEENHKNEKNDQNQEEPGQGIQGLKPPMQMGKGKNSNKMIRHPMGKHPRPPMEKN